MTMLFKHVAFIGLGLIGSSLARAMKKHGLAGHIAGHARKSETREASLKLGFIDEAFERAEDAVVNADLVVICTPLGAYEKIAATISPALKQGAIITDVGSCKMSTIEDVKKSLPNGTWFVAGHPIAGTENSGPEAGFAELFDGRYCILTPDDDTPLGIVKQVKALWEAVGSYVELMDPAHHDRVLAITSHLPHLIAYTIVGTAADLEESLTRENDDQKQVVRTNDVIRFSASGFRDFTRIAGSDPVMWRDVFLNNREAVLEMLGRFTEDLIALQRAVRWGDGDLLEDWFTRTRTIRRSVVDQKQAGTFNAMEPELAIQRLEEKLARKKEQKP